MLIDSRELDIRLSTVLFGASNIILLSSQTLQYRLVVWILHLIATLLSIFHIFRHVAPSPRYFRISHFWRVILLVVYGLISLGFLSIVVSGRNLSISASMTIGVVGIVVSILTIGLVFIMPLPRPFSLPGPFKRIGTTSFVINKSRVMTVQSWFPLSSSNIFSWRRKAIMWTSGHPEHETEECLKLLEALSKLNHVPLFSIMHLSLARTHAEWRDSLDLSALSPKTPVVVYSHGLYGWRQIHHSACEKLASAGFLVFAVDHAPDATVSRPHLEPHNSAIFDFRDGDFLKGKEYRKYYMNGMNRRAQDIDDLLAYVSETPELAKVDKDNVFLFGHSYGGGTAATVAARRGDIAGVALLDAWMYPVPDDDRRRGLPCPVLALSSELWETTRSMTPFRADLFKHSPDGVPRMDFIVQGSDHQNFCDVYRLSSRALLSRPSAIGPSLDPYDIGEAMEDLVVAFFLSTVHSSKDFLSFHRQWVNNMKYVEGADTEAGTSAALLRKYQVLSRLRELAQRAGTAVLDMRTIQLLISKLVPIDEAVDMVDNTYFNNTKEIEVTGDDLAFE